MNKKIFAFLTLVAFFVATQLTFGYQKPEMSMPQRALNSYNSGCLDWEISANLTCEKPIPLNEMVHGMATWGDLIYATGTNGSIFCITKFGALVFAERVPEKPVGIPCIDELEVHVMTEKGSLFTFDRVTGEKKSTVRIAPDGVTDIARYGNYAVVGSSTGLHCIKINNGLRKWNVSLSGQPQPVAIFDNRVVVNYNSGLMCISLLTGDILWEKEVEPGIDKPFFLGVPVIHFDRIFIPLSDGKLDCYGLYNGEKIWEAKHGFSRAPPTTDGGKLWIPGGNQIYCHDIKSGKILWQKEVVGSWVLFTQALKSGDKLFCAGQGDEVVVVSAKNGEVINRLKYIVGTTQEIAAGKDFIAVVNNGGKNNIYVYHQ